MIQKELKAYRLRAGLSQTKLAAVLGLRQANICDWETNYRPMPREVLLGLQEWAQGQDQQYGGPPSGVIPELKKSVKTKRTQ